MWNTTKEKWLIYFLSLERRGGGGLNKLTYKQAKSDMGTENPGQTDLKKMYEEEEEQVRFFYSTKKMLKNCTVQKDKALC